jgi:hypothetical protein
MSITGANISPPASPTFAGTDLVNESHECQDTTSGKIGRRPIIRCVRSRGASERPLILQQLSANTHLQLFRLDVSQVQYGTPHFEPLFCLGGKIYFLAVSIEIINSQSTAMLLAGERKIVRLRRGPSMRKGAPRGPKDRREDAGGAFILQATAARVIAACSFKVQHSLHGRLIEGFRPLFSIPGC